MDAAEARVLSDVEAHGWHMITVPADEHGPGFTYTIGLFKSYAHPEVIVFGLPNEVMQRVVLAIGTLVKEGRRFEHGDTTADVLEGYSCAFRRFLPAHYPQHLGYAMWFYRLNKTCEFPALQCVWPDRNHHFPWHASCDPAIRDLQPVLYEGLGLGA